MVCLPGLALIPEAEHDQLLVDLAESCAVGQDRVAVVRQACRRRHLNQRRQVVLALW